MTRGIIFTVPHWAEKHLRARKVVYFKARQEACKQVEIKKTEEQEFKEDPSTNEKKSSKDGNDKEGSDDDDPVKDGNDNEGSDGGDGSSDNEDGGDDSSDNEDGGDDSSDNEDGGDGDYMYLDLGRSDFWPCYLRSMFIAAYRMVQAEWSDVEDGGDAQVALKDGEAVLVPLRPPKAMVLDTILRVCSPNLHSIPISSHTKNLKEIRIYLRFGMPESDYDKHGSLNLELCFTDYELISVLGAAGFGVLVDMCRDHHMFVNVIDADRISRMAAVLNKLSPYFPTCKEDLNGTPYVSGDPYDENLDERNTMKEIQENFNVLAGLGCGITGIVEY